MIHYIPSRQIRIYQDECRVYSVRPHHDLANWSILAVHVVNKWGDTPFCMCSIWIQISWKEHFLKCLDSGKDIWQFCRKPSIFHPEVLKLEFLQPSYWRILNHILTESSWSVPENTHLHHALFHKHEKEYSEDQMCNLCFVQNNLESSLTIWCNGWSKHCL